MMKDGRAGHSGLTEGPILNELNVIVAEGAEKGSKVIVYSSEELYCSSEELYCLFENPRRIAWQQGADQFARPAVRERSIHFEEARRATHISGADTDSSAHGDN
jgi:hypothetical protein